MNECLRFKFIDNLTYVIMCVTIYNSITYYMVTYIPTVSPPYPWPNPMIMSYNASAVKIYNALSSLVRFQTNKFFFALVLQL
jgi:hypothetical protein